MTRKRYVKMLMSYGYSRNEADKRANKISGSYDNDIYRIAMMRFVKKVITGEIFNFCNKQFKED